MKRIDHLIVSVIVTDYDAAGKPIGEAQSEPVKLFRAAAPDVWSWLDTQMAKTTAPAVAPPRKKAK